MYLLSIENLKGEKIYKRDIWSTYQNLCWVRGANHLSHQIYELCKFSKIICNSIKKNHPDLLPVAKMSLVFFQLPLQPVYCYPTKNLVRFYGSDLLPNKLENLQWALGQYLLQKNRKSFCSQRRHVNCGFWEHIPSADSSYATWPCPASCWGKTQQDTSKVLPILWVPWEKKKKN